MLSGYAVIGLFKSGSNPDILYSAPAQVADMLERHNCKVVRTSTYLNKWRRLADTVKILCTHEYRLAIVPWFNGKGSFWWQHATCLLLRLLGKRYVLVLHGGEIPQLLDKNPTKYLPGLKRAHAISCPSSFIQQSLNKFGVPAIVIENPMHTHSYVFLEKRFEYPKILWMRSLEDIYNVEMILRVAYLLKHKYSHLELYIAGKGKPQYISKLEELVIMLGLEKNVVFTGLLNWESKSQLSNYCNVYTCTNKIDNAPVSVIEMMLWGLPVVSVNSGGLPFIIDDKENGYLVNLNDDQAMADKIINIFTNVAATQKLVHKARLYAEGYAEEKVFVKWQNLFTSLEKRA